MGLTRCVVYFTCADRVVVSVDGRLYGEPDSALPVALPPGRHYVQVQSLDTSSNCALYAAEVREGILTMEGADITVWPNGVCEAQLSAPSPVSTLALDCARYDNNLWAVLYEGAISLEDNNGRCRFSHTLPRLQEGRLLVANRCVTVTGTSGGRRYLCVVGRKDGDFIVTLEERADDLVMAESGAKVALVRKAGETGRARQRVLSLQESGCELLREEKVWLSEPQPPSTAPQAARLFAEAVMCGAENDTLQLLSTSLSGTSFGAIREFFGEYVCVRSPDYFPHGEENVLMLGYRQDGYVRLDPFGYRVVYENGYKIDNFYEV